jgi:RND family efflux transporter MFP subunit
MTKTRLRLCVPVLVALALSACQEPAPPPVASAPRPVPLLTVQGGEIASGLRFPGRVRAVQRAELAFNVPGQIVEFPAVEGAEIAAGELIARLDTESFEVKLSSARARYDKARTDYERVLQIWEKSQAVARAEVDRKRTEMEVARSSYAAAKRDLDDAALRAPFSGVVVRRHVENFQNVQAKEPVVSLQDVNDLEIVVHVPERVMRSRPRQAAGYAQFEDIPGRRFPVSLSSYAAEADPQTQTYEVVLGLTRPQDVNILPGMSAEVIPAADADGEQSISIPLAAVAAAADGSPQVWVFDAEAGRIAARAVTTGAVSGERIVITGGLVSGERIATAGLGQLRDGMSVRPLD